MRGLELRGVDGSLDSGDPGEGSEGQKPGGGAEPPGPKGRRVEVQEPGFDGKNYWFLMEKGRKMLEIIQKDRTRLVVAMDGIN